MKNGFQNCATYQVFKLKKKKSNTLTLSLHGKEQVMLKTHTNKKPQQTQSTYYWDGIKKIIKMSGNVLMVILA